MSFESSGHSCCVIRYRHPGEPYKLCLANKRGRQCIANSLSVAYWPNRAVGNNTKEKAERKKDFPLLPNTFRETK